MDGFRIARHIAPVLVTLMATRVALGQLPLPPAPQEAYNPAVAPQVQPAPEQAGPIVSPYVEPESQGWIIEAPYGIPSQYAGSEVRFATPYRPGGPRRVRPAAGYPPVRRRPPPMSGAAPCGCNLPPMVSADHLSDAGCASETCGEPLGECACGGPGPRRTDGCCPPPGCKPEEKATSCFRLTTEALFLRLSDPGDQALIVATGPPVLPLVSADSLDYDTQSTMRLTLELDCSPRQTLQFIYYSPEWDAHTAAAGGVSLPNGLLAGTFLTARADAALNNEEFNFLYPMGKSQFSLLWGFRHIGFDERLRLASIQAAPPNSFYNISTKNDLFGLQVGARYAIPLDKFLIVMTGKIGAYESISSQHSQLSDAVLLLQSDTTATDRRAASAGEFDINLLLPLGDSVRLSAGYNMIWAGSVARAVDQIDTNIPFTGRSLRNNGDVFLHGANIGLQFIFGGARRRG